MNLLIKNARCETAYQYDGNEIIGTDTEIVDILIESGVITKIASSIDCEGIEVLDAKQQLVVPTLREMHVHVDKTYFGGDWIAPMPTTHGIFSRIDEESRLLPKMLDSMEDKAHAMIQHYIKMGHTHIRTHVNVDPNIGTKHIEKVIEILKGYEDQICYEIVAFPQHGLLRNGPEFIDVMRNALSKGVTHIGGVDPAMVDRNISGVLETTFDLAETYGVGIDLHLHDRDTLGAFEMHRILDLIESRNFKHPVTLSHAFALAAISSTELEDLAKRFAKNNVSISTTVAMGAADITLPIDLLWDFGVSVSIGHDSLIDHWSPFGTGDTIQKLNVVAERFGYSQEFELSQLLRFATGGITPLDSKGSRVWPQRGDEANILLVDAVSSAHLIARRCPISTVISRGNIISKQDFELKGGYRG